MKYVMVWFGCDRCPMTSPQGNDAHHSRALAVEAGWRLGMEGEAVCPDCLVDEEVEERASAQLPLLPMGNPR